MAAGDLALRHQRHRGFPFLLFEIMGDDHHLLYVPSGILPLLATSHRGNTLSFTEQQNRKV